MTVQRIKRKQLTMRKPCDWCGEPALFRGVGWGKCSCAGHRDKLVEWDKRSSRPDYSDAQFYGKY